MDYPIKGTPACVAGCGYDPHPNNELSCNWCGLPKSWHDPKLFQAGEEWRARPEYKNEKQAELALFRRLVG